MSKLVIVLDFIAMESKCRTYCDLDKNRSRFWYAQSRKEMETLMFHLGKIKGNRIERVFLRSAGLHNIHTG